jgi:hypothetical protein
MNPFETLQVEDLEAYHNWLDEREDEIPLSQRDKDFS